MRFFGLSALVMLLSVMIVGCGRSPRTVEVHAAIDEQVRNVRTDMLEATPESLAVNNIKLIDFKQKKSETRANNGLPVFEGTWTATVRFLEPYGWIQMSIDGTKIVKAVGKKGDELSVGGFIHARFDEDDEKWHIGATVNGDPWEPLWRKVADSSGTAPIFGYQTATSDGGRGTASRGASFRPYSKLAPMVEENSEEMKQLITVFEAKMQKAQEAAAALRAKQMEEAEARRKKQQEEREAQQKMAQEQAAELQRVRKEEAEERRRVAEAEAKKRAEEDRRARVMPLLQPLQSPRGAVITTDAGLTMGTVILTATVDAEKYTVKGAGIDLRSMPFKEFTFEGEVNDRNILVMRRSTATTPLEFTRVKDGAVLGGAGSSMQALSDADRQVIDDLIAATRRLADTKVEIAAEMLDADAAKSRAADMKLAGMTGTIIYRDRNDARVAPMFAGEISRSNHTWKEETVAMRMREPVKCKGILIRGGRGATDNLVVVINGVHRVRIDAIAPNGAAVVSMPAGTEVIDVRFEALGSAQSRGIALILD